MQCPSCGFENMPGQKSCALCASSLVATPEQEGFLPPRAHHRTVAQRLRYWTNADTYASRSRLALARVKLQLGVSRPVVEPEWWHVVLCIIPGVGHALLGRFWLGAIQFLIALLSVFLFASSPDSIAGGLGASVFVMLSVFSVFVFCEHHWLSKAPGIGAWLQRVGLLIAILFVMQLLNYYLGFGLTVFSILRMFGGS